ncbi:histidine phosphatase family protein [Lactococcus allomyrinae]|uniref:Histidine phosphatase family protein n=1 Tax=Lactococcus allomyrinae TaxID=2419773 RepID=A0A387BCJ3_9LACT|nr:histidine phosphatase family protein [Lactococcus allomyrinae]AYG00074.1 histidine phosphatase family protein [Lactococcus allomyrinae]
MTTVYFIRHSVPDRSDQSVKNDAHRPLTDEGLRRADELVKRFEAVKIDKIYSSSYLRTVQTVEPIARIKGLEILEISDLRERENGAWHLDFEAYTRRQWADFSYKHENGESLQEVQKRNIHALKQILTENDGRTLIVGTHGTALSTLLNYYDSSFGVADFLRIADVMPYIIKLEFDGTSYLSKKEMTEI